MSKPVITVIIELIGGYFGLLGLGWVFAGDVLRGIIILVGYAIFLSIAGFMTFFSFGILGLIFGPIYVVAPIVSAILVYQFAKDKW